MLLGWGDSRTFVRLGASCYHSLCAVEGLSLRDRLAISQKRKLMNAKQ
jgi:hypothetical protein